MPTGEEPRSLEERRRSSVSCPQEKKKHLIRTEKSGDLVVHVQGDISQQDKRAVFLTVHDLGCNHHSFEDFINRECMSEIKERSIFIHVDVPGHEDLAEPLPDSLTQLNFNTSGVLIRHLPLLSDTVLAIISGIEAATYITKTYLKDVLNVLFQFPTLQELGEDLVTVLDSLQVRYAIGFGEGAGANILARFALAHPTRAIGLILINCTGSSKSVMENFKSKFVNWKESLTQSAEGYLVFHKFGHQIVKDTNEDKDKVMADFLGRLKGTLNFKNVRMYVNAFLNRTDLPLKQYKGDVLLITGMNGSFANVVEKLHRDMEKKQVSLLKIEKAGDVLSETPIKVAHSILLFCKGQGLLTSVTLPGVERQRTFSGCSMDGENKRKFSRGMSMDDYDKPNLRRLSITTSEPANQPK